MLLSNVTASSTACAALLSTKISIIQSSTFPNGFYPTQSRCGTCAAPVPYPSGEPREVLALPLLLDAFVQGAQITEDISKRTRKADLHFLASVFANITTVGLVIALRVHLMLASLQQGATFFTLLNQRICLQNPI